MRCLNILFVFVVILKKSSEVSVEEDLTLTAREKAILEIFKQRVAYKVTHDYQREDIFLIRWLRAKEFNLDAAENMLLKNLEWRRANSMDTWLEEDWSYFEFEYPFLFDTHDKVGRPLLIWNMAEWDIRKATVSGQSEHLQRWWLGAFERGVYKVRQLQAEGKNVTQHILMVDVTGFNFIQHACVQCLPMYVNLMLALMNHYPRAVDKIIVVNVPTIFDVVLNVLRPLMNDEIRSILHQFGTNPNEWKPYLYNLIDEDQLPRSLGGTGY